MLPRLRHHAALIATLLGVALLVMWLSGAHGHRPLAEHGPEHAHGVHGHHHHAHDGPADPAADGVVTHAPAMLAADLQADIRLTALQPPAGKSLGDLPMFALLACIVLLLRLPRATLAALPPRPARRRRPPQLLGPPLRGPPPIAS